MKAIKDFIKKSFIGPWAVKTYSSARKYDSLLRELRYFGSRFAKQSMALKDESFGKGGCVDFFAIATYHVIEKGLAMPQMRPGFGVSRVEELCDLVQNEKLSKEVLEQSVGVLKEYLLIHKKMGFQLPAPLLCRLETLEKKYSGVLPVAQPLVTRKAFFKSIHEEFPEFSQSRHSVRDFDPGVEIDISRIQSAIEIAVTAPSACNRQPVRVHVISDKAVMSECLKIQNGNRGFGHLGNKLLIVTAKVSSQLSTNEFFSIYIDGGIFLMNLAYGLHYNKVAHCILNWFADPEQDKTLRKTIDLPEDENVIAYVICGEPSSKFKQVASPRLSWETIVRYH